MPTTARRRNTGLTFDEAEALGRLLYAVEAAALPGVGEQRIYQVVREDLLPAVRLGRCVRFSAPALKRFCEDGGKAHPGGWRRRAD